MCFVYSSFCSLQLIVLSRSPCLPPRANIARTAVQNVTSTSTQRSAGQLALHKNLLALLSIPYSHQIITGLFSCPIYLHYFLRERRGRRQQPCGAEPCAFFRTTKSTTRYRWYVCVLAVLLFRRWFCSPSRSSSRFFLRKLHPYYCRSERDIASIQHSTDRAISSAQVALASIKSLVALNHGSLLSWVSSFYPHHIYELKSSLRERS